MIKHIIGQAFYQFIVVCTLIFTADSWVNEYLPKEEIEGYSGQLKYYSGNLAYKNFYAYD